jgi:hypothetical protein
VTRLAETRIKARFSKGPKPGFYDRPSKSIDFWVVRISQINHFAPRAARDGAEVLPAHTCVGDGEARYTPLQGLLPVNLPIAAHHVCALANGAQNLLLQ